MRPSGIGRFTLILTLSVLTSGCAIFQGNKKPVELNLRYNKEAYINYGYAFELGAYLIYSNEKEKEITQKDELKLTVRGADYYKGKVTIANYPQKLSSNTIYVDATYSKDDVTLSSSLQIPFNYKGVIDLNFSGSQGATGVQGTKGSTPLLFRDGNEGGDGGPGGEGYPGDHLTIYVWKDSVDFYFIRIFNIASNQTYIYKTKVPDYGFVINVNGGQGGTGGSGGDGGDGKDGSNNNNKLKAPGNGGRGGSGGMGGTGGKGGNVYIFIHPNAAQWQSKFVIYNYGGSGGYGGKAGEGGRAGRPLEGQTAATAGTKGTSGQGGYNGNSGDAPQIFVEEFDIEY